MDDERDPAETCRRPQRGDRFRAVRPILVSERTRLFMRKMAVYTANATNGEAPIRLTLPEGAEFDVVCTRGASRGGRRPGLVVVATLDHGLYLYFNRDDLRFESCSTGGDR